MLSVNKQAIAAAFGRAAKSYSLHDALQRCSASKLRTILDRDDFASVLDAGCGPGSGSRAWRSSTRRVIALDLSPEMVVKARERQAADVYLVADIEALPFSNSCFDLVWSHLALQWCASLEKALNELYRVTRAGGVVAFTTLLDLSLLELRQAWRAVDSHSHVNRFLSQAEVKVLLAPWRYRYAIQIITIEFDNAIAAMQSLKGIGATYLQHGRPRKILTRSELQRLEIAWPQRKGHFPLTYQLFYGVIERD